MAELYVLSAGAAQAVASALTPQFCAATLAEVRASFQPVGALKEKFLAGESCDVVVSTAAMLEQFSRDARIDGATISPLGRVHTGIAVRSGERAPAIGDRDELRAALERAVRVYVPDPERATAGIHFVKVLHGLGLYDALAPRLAAYPNGAAAMAALAAATDRDCLGCTQVTEIKYTRGVTLVGTLPPEFDLATLYAAAVSRSAREPELALRFVRMLAGTESERLRGEAGFDT
jgi:molybdate transport system substrate-binding protein